VRDCWSRSTARLEAAATRVEAAATNAQLRALQALTDTALSHLALDDLLRELLGRVIAMMGVDNVAILLLDEDSQTLTVRAARGPEEEAIGRVQIPVGQGFAGRIAARREPLIVDDLATFEAERPLLGPKLRAVVGVPLLMEEQVEGRVASRLVGVVHVGSAAPRRFSEADAQPQRRRRAPRSLDRSRRCMTGWRRRSRARHGSRGCSPGSSTPQRSARDGSSSSARRTTWWRWCASRWRGCVWQRLVGPSACTRLWAASRSRSKPTPTASPRWSRTT
jgi:putative methionine-R-sulfoxide reductase with GAF domain